MWHTWLPEGDGAYYNRSAQGSPGCSDTRGAEEQPSSTGGQPAASWAEKEEDPEESSQPGAGWHRHCKQQIPGPHQRHIEGWLRLKTQAFSCLQPVQLQNICSTTKTFHWQDIRYQRRYRQRRKAELVKLQQTLTALNSKTAFYQDQMNYYDTYIKTCLDNLNRKWVVASVLVRMKRWTKWFLSFVCNVRTSCHLSGSLWFNILCDCFVCPGIHADQ